MATVKLVIDLDPKINEQLLQQAYEQVRAVFGDVPVEFDTKAARDSAKGLADEMDKVKAGAEKAASAADGIPEAAKKATDSAGKYADEMENAKKASEQTADATDRLPDTLKKATDETKGLAGLLRFDAINSAIDRVSSSIGSFIGPYKEFDTQLKNIGTLGVKNFEDFRNAAIDLAADLPDTVSGVTESVYNAISAGAITVTDGFADVGQGMKFVESAAKLAVAGLTDTNAAVQGLASVTNAYGTDILQPAEAADILFSTVKNGVTTIEQLNGSLSNVVPVAASLGVGFDQVGGAIATLTKSGTPTAQATTQIRAALTELAKPGKELARVMNEAGVSLETLKQDGLQVTIQKLGQGMDSLGLSAFQTFSSVEAIGAALNLAGEGALTDLEAIRADAGAVEGAYEIASQGIAVKVQGLLNQIEAVAFKAFGALGDGAVVAVDAVSQIAPIVSTFAGLKDVIPSGLFDPIAGSAKSVVETVTGSLSQMPKIAGDAIKNVSASLQAFPQAGLEAGKKYASAFGDSLKNLPATLGDSFAGLSKNLASRGGDLVKSVSSSFAALSGQITGSLSGIGGTIVNAFKNPLATLVGGFNAVKISAASTWAAITGPVGLTVAALAAVGVAAYALYDNFDEIRVAVDQVWQFLVQVFDELKPLFIEIGGLIYEYFVGVFEIAKTVIVSVYEVISNLVSGLFQTGDATKKAGENVSLFSRALDTVRSAVDSARSVIAGLIAGFNALKDGLQDVIKSIASGNIGDAIKRFFSIGGDAIDAGVKASNQKAEGLALDRAVKKAVDGADKSFAGFADAVSKGVADIDQRIKREQFSSEQAYLSARLEAIKRAEESERTQRSATIAGFRDGLKKTEEFRKLSAAEQQKIEAQFNQKIAQLQTTRSKDSIEAEAALRKQTADASEERKKKIVEDEKAVAKARKDGDDKILEGLRLRREDIALANEKKQREDEITRARNNQQKGAADELTIARENLRVLEDQRKATEAALGSLRTDDARKKVQEEIRKLDADIDKQRSVVVVAEINVDKATAEANKKLAEIRLSRLRIDLDLGRDVSKQLQTELASQIASLQSELQVAENRLDLAVGAEVEPAFKAVSDLYSKLQKLKSDYDKTVEASTAASYERQRATGEQYSESYAQLLESEKRLKSERDEALLRGDSKSYADLEGQLRAYTEAKKQIETSAATLSIDLTTEASDKSLAAIQNQIALQKQLGDTFVSVGTAVGDTFANILTGAQGAANALVSVVFDALDAMIPILSAQIFGVMVASPNPANALSFGASGALAAGILTATLKGLLAAARAALGRKDGEFNIGGDRYSVDGSGKFGLVSGDYSAGRDRILRFHEPGETIFSRQNTRKNHGLFKFISETGRPWTDYPEVKRALAFAPAEAYIDNAALLDDRRIVAAINSLGDRIESTRARDTRTQVDVKFKGRGVKELIEAEQYNQSIRM